MYRINRNLVRLTLTSMPELHLPMTDWILNVVIDTETLEYNAILKESNRLDLEDENAVEASVTIPAEGIEALAAVAMNPAFMTLKDEEIFPNTFILDGIDYHIDIQSPAGRFDHSSSVFMDTMDNGIIESTKGSFVTGLDLIFKALNRPE